MYPRFRDKQLRELPGAGTSSQRCREAMSKLARRRRAPGLLAFDGNKPLAGSPMLHERNSDVLMPPALRSVLITKTFE
jgi:hypothetical protein